MDRRNFLKVGGAAGAGLLVPWQAEMAFAGAAKAAAASPSLSKFTEILPAVAPAVYSPKGRLDGVPLYTIAASQGTATPHAALGAIPIFGYGGTWPSMSIEAVVNQPFYVNWLNQLPRTHILASGIDHGNPNYPYPDYMGILGITYPNGKFADNRIVTHLHGGHVPWTSDGGPKGWYTPNSTLVGPQYNGDTYYYPNQQRATTLWFHDHAMGITRINVYAGMAGFYILRDTPATGPDIGVGNQLGLPAGPYEIPLVFQDRSFTAAPGGGYQLFYAPPPEVPEFFGDVMTVNGVVWPRMKVEPRQYRFRLLNGCDARFLRMRLVESDPQGNALNINNSDEFFYQIGTDGGLLGKTAVVDRLLQAPAERCDVIVDFSKWRGRFLLLYNDASTPFGNTNKTVGAIKEVMLFEVADTTPVTGTIPTVLDSSIQPIDPRTFVEPATKRQITLDEITDVNGMLRQLLNMRGYETTFDYKPAAADTAVNITLDGVGQKTEEWVLVNTTVDVHPIHMHQQMFRIVSRQAFNTNAYQKARAAAGQGIPVDITPFLTGSPVPPDDNEQGWKDTVRANPGWVTKLVATFDIPAGTKDRAAPQIYVTHCHILEHEEHDMMLPINIYPGSTIA